VIAAIPLQIFLSPLLPFDDNNNMTTQNSRAIDAGSLTAMAPPGYGDHRLDRLYNDVDPSGFQTPAGLASGLATPLVAISRNVSGDNLASMNESGFNNSAANTLRNRLNNLHITEDTQATQDRTQAMSSLDLSPGNGPPRQQSK